MGIAVNKTGLQPALKLRTDAAKKIQELVDRAIDEALHSPYEVDVIERFRIAFQQQVKVVDEEEQHQLSQELLQLLNHGRVERFEVAEVINSGADVNIRSGLGLTPLHYAVIQNDIPLGISLGVIDLLIERGAKVNAKDDSKSTPLHKAAAYGYTEKAKRLIKHGANINAKNDGGETPLDVALRGKNKGVADLLKIANEIQAKS